MKATYSKKEKLKSQKLIEQLFSEGKSVSAYPLRMVYLKTTFNDNTKLKTGVSVSKRNFKKAVDRNRIKRLLREAYRLNKASYFNNITTSYALMILYIGKDGTDFETVDKKTKQLFKSFLEKISRDLN
ncbi:ribonuclease P protein component [Ichthyenterobacterium magnum]|uniref:Ribonuclease P protein component n=1 Tax=Ichthyenterobacterium magnum TaxID=1230530 RepID=A0A420DX16_9FLAO|nr:ribonuclease P protein component [Ichthyenterobacterium magnum]RKE98780.1 ribonuclease P protein component [Ichthyenterobacterium magnum]